MKEGRKQQMGWNGEKKKKGHGLYYHDSSMMTRNMELPGRCGLFYWQFFVGSQNPENAQMACRCCRSPSPVCTRSIYEYSLDYQLVQGT